MPSEEERRNLERVKHWEWTYNNAVDRMVDECYAPDCVVVAMHQGMTLNGREELRQLEHTISANNASRRMEITRTVASGDTVAIQVDAVSAERRSKACIFLTFNSDGLITLDNTYAYDPSAAAAPA